MDAPALVSACFWVRNSPWRRGRECEDCDVFLGGVARVGGGRGGGACDGIGGGASAQRPRGARVYPAGLRQRRGVLPRRRLVSLLSAQLEPQFRGRDPGNVPVVRLALLPTRRYGRSLRHRPRARLARGQRDGLDQTGATGSRGGVDDALDRVRPLREQFLG